MLEIVVEQSGTDAGDFACGCVCAPGIGGGNDEREQTLNQLLTEMDGFEGNTGEDRRCGFGGRGKRVVDNSGRGFASGPFPESCCAGWKSPTRL